MGRKTYWSALDVNTTVIVSSAIAGAVMTNQHTSKNTEREALILPMIVLLHRSLTLGTNYSGDNLLAKDLSGARPEHTPRILTCQVRSSKNCRSTAFSRREFRRCGILTELWSLSMPYIFICCCY